MKVGVLVESPPTRIFSRSSPPKLDYFRIGDQPHVIV